MKRFLLAVVVVVALVAAAYISGYWPEYQRRVALEAEVAAARGQVADLEARVRAAHLLGEMLRITEAVTAMNYGEAQTLSSRFFDNVREEAARSPVAELRSALEAILRSRDAITGALARGDQTVLDTLRTLQIQLRAALGYPVIRS